MHHWSEAGQDVLVLGNTADDPERVVEMWRRAGVGAILIQYVPFLYGRRGLSRFPRRMAAEARAIGLRTTVFVHEPWVPPTRMPWLVLSPLQRRQLRRILTECDAAITAVPAWRDMLGGNVSVLYVGSTLGDPRRIEAGGTELPSPTVFSPFASGLAWDWILAAAQAVGAQPPLTVIGTDWETARRHPIVKRWADPAWDWQGRLDGPRALDLLARARIVLAPFVDGLTGRRTSAFAAASTAARLLSSRGPLFDTAFEESPISLANTKAEFCDMARRLFHTPDHPALRRQRAEWYDAHLAPRQIDEQLLRLVAFGARG